MLSILKKDGTLEEWNPEKIKEAVYKASLRANTSLSKKDLNTVVKIVRNMISTSEISTTVLHTKVIAALKGISEPVANSYQEYRDYKNTYAKEFEKLKETSENTIFLGDRENANFDSSLISTQGSLIKGYLTKSLYKQFYLSKKEKEYVKRGDIYIHDLRDMIFGSVNCLTGSTWITLRYQGKPSTVTIEELRQKLHIKEPSTYGISPNIEILSRGMWVKLEAISMRETELEEDLYEIITEEGIPIKATADHRIPVINSDGEEELKYVKDITTQDSLIITSSELVASYSSENQEEYTSKITDLIINKKVAFWTDATYAKLNTSKVIKINKSRFNIIYVFDLQTSNGWFIANGNLVHNCCLFDMDNVLKNGFEMSNVKYTEPKSVLTALQVIGDITLVASAQQFGGFTIPEIDKILLPYCKKSYKYWLKKYEEFIEDKCLVERIAKREVIKELHQGFQSLELKLNTVPSSRGDFAFTTLTFGHIPKSLFPDEREWMYEIGKTILDTREKGHGGTRVVFPKLVFLYDEDLCKDGSFNEKLFNDAVKCSSKCLYPDYLSLTGVPEYNLVASTYKNHNVITSPMGA